MTLTFKEKQEMFDLVKANPSLIDGARTFYNALAFKNSKSGTVPETVLNDAVEKRVKELVEDGTLKSSSLGNITPVVPDDNPNSDVVTTSGNKMDKASTDYWARMGYKK